MSAGCSAFRALVSGRVQGVGFRAATVEAARRAGAVGWVRNLADGRVEAVVEGDAAVCARVYDFLKTGPKAARVDHVEWTPLEETFGFASFEHRR